MQCADPGLRAMAACIVHQWPAQGDVTLLDADFSFGSLFLLLRAAWRARAGCASGRPARLHIVAVVPQPFSREALGALYADPSVAADLRAESSALVAQWPYVLPGQHRLSFDDGAVTLTLLFGAPEVTLRRAGCLADGLYAYAPPDLRNRLQEATTHAVPGDPRPLLNYLGKLAAPGAWWICNWRSPSLVTCLQKAAFVPRPVSDSTTAALTVADRRAGLPSRSALDKQGLATQASRQAIVVGGGIAGAHVAYSLAERGWQVAVFADGNPHTGHIAAAMTPVVAADDNPRARLTRAGALLAQTLWSRLPEGMTRRCGTVQLDAVGTRAPPMSEVLDALQFPMGWVRPVSRRTASALCGLPVARGGAFFSSGTLVRPDGLIAQLLAHPSITVRHGQVTRVQQLDGAWRAVGPDGRVRAEAGVLILATARHTPAILAASGLTDSSLGGEAWGGMQALAGEITLLNGDGPLEPLRRVVGGEGYLLPAVGGKAVAGSTYVRGALTADISLQGQQINLGKAAGLLARNPPTVGDTLLPGWSGWRAVVPGRLPVIGPWPDTSGLWLATAYASRGLTWAAMAGQMIAGALEGEPDVIETDLARAISPARLK